MIGINEKGLLAEEEQYREKFSANGRKSSAELSSERKDFLKMKREREKARARNEGRPATETNLENMLLERDRAAHEMLRAEGFYEVMQNTYAAKTDELPSGIKIINKMLSVVGMRHPQAGLLEEKIGEYAQLSNAEFERRYERAVREASEAFVANADAKVNRAGHISREQRELCRSVAGELSGRENQAVVTANNIRILEKKTEEYLAGIASVEHEIRLLAGTEFITEGDKEALSLRNSQMRIYKDNMRLAQDEMTDSLTELKTLDAEIIGLRSQYDIAEALNAKFTIAHGVVQANTARLRQYFQREGQMGCAEFIHAMNQLADGNKGISSLLSAFDSYTRRAFDETELPKLEVLDPDFVNQTESSRQIIRSAGKDLVHKYATIKNSA